MGTTFIEETGGCPVVCTEFAQRKPRNPDKRVTFPVTVEYYDQRAKVYAPAKGFPFYRVAFKVDGKRRMLTFGTYTEAKTAAESKVKELHKGQKSSALTAKQAQDALTVRDMLAAYRLETGKVLSIVELTAKRHLAAQIVQGEFDGCTNGRTWHAILAAMLENNLDSLCFAAIRHLKASQRKNQHR